MNDFDTVLLIRHSEDLSTDATESVDSYSHFGAPLVVLVQTMAAGAIDDGTTSGRSLPSVGWSSRSAPDLVSWADEQGRALLVATSTESH
jgi:hypothetical protein